MSEWAYINGSILVEVPGKTQEEKDKTVAALLKELPKINGSEGPMCVQVLMLEGYGERPNPKFVAAGLIDGPIKQDFYNIVVTGFLRDMLLEEAKNKLSDFLIQLADRVLVRKMGISCQGINGNYELEESFYGQLVVEKLEDMVDYEARESFYERITNGNN
mgnify:CR=1 FL=1